MDKLIPDWLEPPKNTEQFNKLLQWLLGDNQDVKLETWAIGDIDSERGYSEDGRIAENIYRFTDNGARFQITVTQLPTEDEGEDE